MRLAVLIVFLASAWAFLKVIKFSEVGCVLNLRSNLLRFMTASLHSYVNQGLGILRWLVDDFGMVLSAISSSILLNWEMDHCQTGKIVRSAADRIDAKMLSSPICIVSTSS